VVNRLPNNTSACNKNNSFNKTFKTIIKYYSNYSIFLQIVCDPVLLYGLEACALNKSQMASVYFVVNQFFLKLFKTNNIETVKGCQEFFSFELPSEWPTGKTCGGEIWKWI